ncbi:MAG: penicillin-binding protein activator [Gammaproteobacteria bacterium]
MIEMQFTGALRRAATAILVLVLVGFAACTSITPSTRPTPSGAGNLEARAKSAVEARNYSAAADLYAQLATGATGATRVDYLLEAARYALEGGDRAGARRRLNDARGSATPAQQQGVSVLLARIELAERRPQPALDILAAIPQPLGDVARIDAAAIRGQALFQLARPIEAVRVLAERELWLNDAASILANQRMIWDGLRQNPSTAALAPVGDKTVDGWLALAPLVATSGQELRRALLTWRQTYTDHPAAGGLLAELLASQRGTAWPAHIALLLPLSSPQRVAALAVRDGFMAAHLRGPHDAGTTVRVYDTAPGTQQAYLKAQLDGADFIVGPLLKPEVDQVIAQAGFVPTLALNFATKDGTFLRSFYQFALAPEDEARTVAATAAASGAKTALAFVPSTARGNQIRDAFRVEFEARGGQLVDSSGYDPSLQDFSRPIASLLNITRSEQRYRRLAANLGTAVQFEPRRRHDVDMIFIVADARTARLLVPQLRFYSAGDIPTYATADIFDPSNTRRSTDLNGVIFADTPALLAPDDAVTSVTSEWTSFWPQRLSQLRLYGMGIDAYNLIGSLYAGDGRPAPMRGLSGDLSLDDQGRVHRTLPLAQFRNGQPAAIDAPPIIGSSSNSLSGRH